MLYCLFLKTVENVFENVFFIKGWLNFFRDYLTYFLISKSNEVSYCYKVCDSLKDIK